jgi:hypothetical protein
VHPLRLVPPPTALLTRPELSLLVLSSAVPLWSPTCKDHKKASGYKQLMVDELMMMGRGGIGL